MFDYAFMVSYNCRCYYLIQFAASSNSTVTSEVTCKIQAWIYLLSEGLMSCRIGVVKYIEIKQCLNKIINLPASKLSLTFY